MKTSSTGGFKILSDWRNFGWPNKLLFTCRKISWLILISGLGKSVPKELFTKQFLWVLVSRKFFNPTIMALLCGPPCSWALHPSSNRSPSYSFSTVILSIRILVAAIGSSVESSANTILQPRARIPGTTFKFFQRTPTVKIKYLSSELDCEKNENNQNKRPWLAHWKVLESFHSIGGVAFQQKSYERWQVGKKIKLFFSFVDSVIRWPSYVFKILPFSAMKICPIAYRLCKVSWKFTPKPSKP